MDSSKLNISLKSMELENEGNKYICKIHLINEILNIFIYLNNNILKYEGNIALNKIQNQIGAFNDYNINEIFEEINILDNNNFKIIKEKDNEYKLKIKFIILRRKKYLYINLYNNNIDKNYLIKYILELKEIIKNKNEKIKLLENKLNKQNYQEINNKYDLCSKCEEENSHTGSHPHDFIKIRNNKNQNHQNNNNNSIKINNDEENNNTFNINANNIFNHEENDNILEEIQNDEVNHYSYECLNVNKLSTYLYEGTPECRIQIILRNNGKSAWPMNNAKLTFDEFCDFKAKEVILKPQRPQELELYEIVYKDLYGYPPNEYNSILKFSVNDQFFGDDLQIKFEIKSKKVPNNDNEVNIYKEKIEEFRELYYLSNDKYSDDKLLNALKINNFDYALAFGNLFD